MKKHEIAIDCLLTVKTLSVYLNVPISRIYNLVFKKEIPHLKIGSSVRFRKSDIQKYLEGKEAKTITVSNSH